VWRIPRLLLLDLLRGWSILGYSLLLAAAGWGAVLLQSRAESAALAVLQAVLLLVPLATMVLTVIYYFSSLEFVTLLLTRPIPRSRVLGSLYAALCCAFSLAFLVGVAPPLLAGGAGRVALVLLPAGLLLTSAGAALALAACTLSHDKTRCMGAVLVLWAFLALFFDGALLLLLYQFGDYPIEPLILGLTFLNPVVLVRSVVLMGTDASALLGLPGAIFVRFFGGDTGRTLVFAALVAWTFLPFALAAGRFRKRDL
jgi:Cu-processing system permease protein